MIVAGRHKTAELRGLFFHDLAEPRRWPGQKKAPVKRCHRQKSQEHGLGSTRAECAGWYSSYCYSITFLVVATGIVSRLRLKGDISGPMAAVAVPEPVP